MWWLIAGAAVGAIAGGINTWQQRSREEAEVRQQRENAKKQYLYGKAYGDSQYSIQKGEALWQLGMQDRSLREGMGQFMDQYNTHLLGRAYGEQDARMQTASGIGASLVSEGMSGTRGNEANQLMRDYAQTSLDRQIDLQRQQDSNTLSATMQDAGRAATSINHEKDSWEEGGHRYEMKTAQDKYNYQIYQLGQDNYDWQLDMHKKNEILDYTAGIFGGASQGVSTARSVYNYNYDWNWNKGFK